MSDHKFKWSGKGGFHTWCIWCHLVWLPGTNRPTSRCPKKF